MKPSTSYEFTAIACLVLIVGAQLDIGPRFIVRSDMTVLWVIAAVAAATSTILREMGR